jgi:hypothetical protein
MDFQKLQILSDTRKESLMVQLRDRHLDFSLRPSPTIEGQRGHWCFRHGAQTIRSIRFRTGARIQNALTEYDRECAANLIRRGILEPGKNCPL